jgi:SAM-dependent methyltransferase
MSTAAPAIKALHDRDPRAPSPFDTARAEGFSERRKEFLDRFLPELIRSHNIHRALDVGCGFGYFSRYLSGLGLQVTAIDGREDNVREARRRNPNVECIVGNVEEVSAASLGRFDLVFCFGLLYHLENPFKALRNLEALTGKIALLETVVAPLSGQATVLYEEPTAGNQGLEYIASIPSEAWFLKSLYRVGFPVVFRTKELPDHPDFRSGLIKKRMRTVLLVARGDLQFPFLEPVPEPAKTPPFLWDRPPFRYFLRHEGLRNALKRLVPAGLLGLRNGH